MQGEWNNMFEALIKRLKMEKVSEGEGWLRIGCSLLGKANKGLAEEVTSYVLTGAPTSCLHKIESMEKVLPSYSPFELIREPYEYTELENEQIFSSMPRFMSSSVAQNPDVLKRLSTVINVCDGDHTFHNKETKIEGWCSNMLHLLEEYYSRDNATGQKGTYLNRDSLIDITKKFKIPERYIDAYILEGMLGCYLNNENFISHLRSQTDWLEILKSPEYQAKVLEMSASAREAICYQVKLADQTLPKEIVPLASSLLADKSKAVRKIAYEFINILPANELRHYLTEKYSHKKASIRRLWIELTEELSYGEELLEKWRETESSESIKNFIEEKSLVISDKGISFKLNCDVIPEYTAEMHDLSCWNENILYSLERMINSEKQWAKHIQSQINELSNMDSQQLKIASLEEQKACCESRLARCLEINKTDIENHLQFIRNGNTSLQNRTVAEALEGTGIFKSKTGNLIQFLRNSWCLDKFSHHSIFNNKSFLVRFYNEVTDFRQLIAIFNQNNEDADKIIEDIIHPQIENADDLPFSKDIISIWQFFAENPDYIEMGLKGRLPNAAHYYENVVIARSLYLLGLFPSIPPHWENELYTHALGRSKILREVAQASANSLGIKRARVEKSLYSNNKDERVIAAKWLGSAKQEMAAGELFNALNKEKDLLVRAVFFDALEELNQDISGFITKDKLLLEAESGLRKPIPASMKKFPKQDIPELHFCDGAHVPSALILWWIILAVKLKDPKGNNLFRRYTSLLDITSQRKLGLFILSTFISSDTCTPNDNTCHQYADEHKQKTLDNYKSWGGDYKNATIEEVYQILFNKKKSEVIGSAIKNKGMLGLISELDSDEALTLLNTYMKKHYTRRAQIESMIIAISRCNDDRIIQFLLSVAQRYRTQSVQQVAKGCVETIARERNWSADTLADLTIPSAGLDEVHEPTGFEYGHRYLFIRLTNELKLQLLNEKKEPLRSLPQPSIGDDETAIKATKKWFNDCKKDLKRVVEIQKKRLVESMISDKRWSFKVWKERLVEHPVMFNLLQRVLWQVRIRDEWVCFFINDSGEFIDIKENKLLISDNSEICVLSANRVSNEEISLWQKRIKGEKVKLLFEQLIKVELSIIPQQEKLNQFHGYIIDALVLSGLMIKLGYKRGSFDELDRYYEYHKDFSDLGIKAVLTFSGGHFPDIKMTVAIFDMIFVHEERHSLYPKESRIVSLKDLPESLLHAVALEYQIIASKCQYTPDWKNKIDP